jgi:hypothetical protein
LFAVQVYHDGNLCQDGSELLPDKSAIFSIVSESYLNFINAVTFELIDQTIADW